MADKSNENFMTDHIRTHYYRKPIAAFVWDRETLELVGTALADPDPMDLENWIKPFCSSFDAPPEVIQNQTILRDVDCNKWVIEKDFRGTEYWLPDGTHHTISELGEELPEGALLEEPPKPEPTFEQRLASTIAQREATYKRESDPLYMEWQYDQTEEAEQKWREKVAEIKARFPLPIE